MPKHRLLFVCLGNICRSPMAEGAFRRLAAQSGMLDRFEIDSAGLGEWHVGQAPDARAQSAARRREVDISDQRARQVTRGDYDRFDLLLAMDESVYAELARLAPRHARHKVRHFLDFAPHLGAKDVPDPFFGEREGFDQALDLIEAAARGLLEELVGNPSRPSRRGVQSSSG